MAEPHPHSLEQISIADWEATPASVKNLISYLFAKKLNSHQLPASDLGTDGNSLSEKQENIGLTQFLDAASVGIAVHNAYGDLIYINQSGKELLTQFPSPKTDKLEELPQAFQMYRSTTQQYYPLEELPVGLALAGKKVHVEDMELHSLDRIIPLEVTADPIFNPLGEVEYVIATFLDITHRRLSEQALLENKTRYQQVVETQTDFIVRSLPDTTVTFANPARCRALGRSLEEIVGKKWIDISNPENFIDTLRQISQLTLENPSFLVENCQRRADGTIGWTQWLNQGIFNTQGELIEIQSVGRDITALKQTEAALRESESRLQSIIANIPGTLFRYLRRTDGSDQLLYVSPGCYELCGVEAQVVETSVQVLWDMVHPEDLPRLQESMILSVQTLQSWFWQCRITIPSGQQKWIQGIGKPELTPENDVVWDILILDITKQQAALQERQRVELELHSQKELLQLIFDHIPLMVGLYSPTGEVLMINRQLEQIRGWTKEEYQTIDVLRECYPDPAVYEARIQHIKAADSTWRDFKTKVRDGRIIDTSWIEIRLADGRTIGIGQDITEQKRLVAALAQINQELELRVAQRTEALEQQKELLKEAERVAHLGSWELIEATGEVIWSEEMFRIFGYDPLQYAPSYGQQDRNFNPKDRQRLKYLVDRAIQYGEPYELDMQIIREDGSLGYIFAKGQPQIDEDGQVRRLVGIAMDISDRKAAEAALAESEAQNRAIVRAIPDIMFRINRAEVYLSYSGSKELLLSFGNEQIIGQPMRNYLPSEHYQRQVHHMTVALETRQTQVYEQEVIIAGNLQQEEVRVVPIEDREEVLFMIRDISDRKRAEQEIIHSRELREVIFNESTDALFLLDPQTGLIVDCNQRAVELLEAADKADLLGIAGHNFQREHFTDEELAAIQLEMTNKMTWSRELEYVTQQGNSFWGSIAVKNIVVAGKNTILVRVTDIRDRKRAEQEIIQNRDLREAIFNELADALFLVDSETLLTLDCNQKAVELFEVKDKADLIGIAGHTLQRYQFTLEELAGINRDMETNGFWSREIEYVTQKGNCFWGNIAAKPIVVAGRTMNLVRVTDISNNKQAEAKIQQTARQLEVANRELESFAYSVSHDLRAPLRAIDGFSKALLEDYGDCFDEEAQDYFDRIHRAVERMGDLIDDLLRLSKVSRAEVQCRQVNLTGLVQEIAANLQELEPQRQVEFVIAPEAIVNADQNLMRIVLENLLQNAWKFTSHHPAAHIEFGIMENSKEAQGATQPKIIYFIRDDGAGFDMAYSTMLFGVFQRLHNTHEFPGTGIGLATVQRVIHRHGGEVWAEGTVEAGATIYFTLPNHIRINA